MSERNRGSVNNREHFRWWVRLETPLRGLVHGNDEIGVMENDAKPEMMAAPSLAPSLPSLFTSIKGNLWYLK